MTTHLKNVHYVTSHFQELQGLRLIPLGLLLLAGAIGTFEWAPWTDFMREDWEQSTFLLLLVLAAFYWLIVKYYGHRFGTVEGGSNSSKKVKTAVLFWIAFLIAFVLDISLSSSFSFITLVVGLAILYEGLDGSKRYGRILLGFIFTVFAFWPVLPVDNIPFTAITTLLGVGIILVGIYDHLILVRTLRAIQKEQHG